MGTFSVPSTQCEAFFLLLENRCFRSSHFIMGRTLVIQFFNPFIAKVHPGQDKYGADNEVDGDTF